MESRFIVTAILVGLLVPTIYGQETKNEKPASETKPAAPRDDEAL